MSEKVSPRLNKTLLIPQWYLHRKNKVLKNYLQVSLSTTLTWTNNLRVVLCCKKGIGLCTILHKKRFTCRRVYAWDRQLISEPDIFMCQSFAVDINGHRVFTGRLMTQRTVHSVSIGRDDITNAVTNCDFVTISFIGKTTPKDCQFIAKLENRKIILKIKKVQE